MPLETPQPRSTRLGRGPLTRREILFLSVALLSLMVSLGTWHASSRLIDKKETALPFKPLITTLDQHNWHYEQHYPKLYITPPIPESKAYRCPHKTLPQVKDNLQSQQGEDVELISYFNGLCGGRYMELGALDGKTFSNSWVFHTEFQWSGVLVELDESQYHKLMRHRLHELFRTRAAICPTGQVIHYVTGHDAVNGVWEYASAEFRQRWWPNVQGPEELETLECVPLQDLLESQLQHIQDSANFGLFYFDFLSLDVEGSEWNVLQTINWDKTHFGVILVEAPDNKGMERAAMITYLQRQGYRHVGEKNNSLWFLHGNFHEIYKTLLS